MYIYVCQTVTLKYIILTCQLYLCKAGWGGVIILKGDHENRDQKQIQV